MNWDIIVVYLRPDRFVAVRLISFLRIPSVRLYSPLPRSVVTPEGSTTPESRPLNFPRICLNGTLNRRKGLKLKRLNVKNCRWGKSGVNSPDIETSDPVQCRGGVERDRNDVWRRGSTDGQDQVGSFDS